MKINRLEYPEFEPHSDFQAATYWIDEDGFRNIPGPGNTAHRFAPLFAEAGIPKNKLIQAEQVHGNRVEFAGEGGILKGCDGLAASRTDLHLAIRTADCAALMLFDPHSGTLMNLHVGWRGARSGIIAAGVHLLRKYRNVKSQHLQVWASPFIRACCYEIGAEFTEYFPRHYFIKVAEKQHFDLQAVIADQLRDSGILAAQVFMSKHCTFCSPMNLPSYRRTKTENRLVNIIYKRRE